jgi:phosphohistidine swiveling domain-containing protein
MPQGPRGTRELELPAARELDGIWIAAGLSEAPCLPPTPLGWELLYDDVELLAAALERRGASLSRRNRRLISVDGHAFQAFLPLARAAEELVPLDAEGLSLAIAGEVREDVTESRRHALASRGALALLSTRIVRGLPRLESRVRAHEQDASQHYRWLVEMDLGILPDDALKTTISECIAIQRSSRALEIAATLDLLGGYAAVFALARRARLPHSEQLAAAALVPEPLELASATPALALASALNASPASSAGPGRAGRIADYLVSFGDRGPCEREPFVPRWAESVPEVERALALLERSDSAKREARMTEARHARSECLARAVAGVPLLDRVPLRALLATLRRVVALRSRLHLVRARTLFMLRTATLDVDRRLGRLNGSEPGLAFFLHLAELTESTWRPDPRHVESARARREVWLRARTLLAPPALFGRGVSERPLEWPLHGVGLGGGELTGPATVARELADALALEPGGVLVTRSLEPGWAPILPAAAAIVTDVGGLAHEGVIAAGALGVPLVIGVRDATKLIRSGERLRVDAVAGTVHRA